MRNAFESQKFARDLAVNGIARARQRAAAEGHDRRARFAVVQALEIAQEHFRIGVEILRAVDGLCLSEVGISGHDMSQRCLCLFQEYFDHVSKRVAHAVDGIHDVEAEIGRNLIVARTGGVQFFARISDAFDQRRFDERVNVFIAFHRKRAAFDVAQDGFQSLADDAALLFGQNAAFAQHGGVRDRAADILRIQFSVEGQTFIERVGVRRRCLCKPAFP